jgi:hypothetical protein
MWLQIGQLFNKPSLRQKVKLADTKHSFGKNESAITPFCLAT